MAIWGVDPGHWGGLAFMYADNADVFPMPAASGHEYDVVEIANMLGDARKEGDLLVIERVTRPASLTRCQGIFEGLGVALGYRVETVRLLRPVAAAMSATGTPSRIIRITFGYFSS